MSKAAIVTGGSGFLGMKVAQKLRETGFTVDQMALPNEDVEGKHFFKGDITDPEGFSFPLADTIVHCAGILESSHPTDEMMFRVNFEGTKNVFNEGMKKGLKKFVFISTIAAIGPQGTAEIPMTENTPPDPKDAYGLSKLKAERFLEKMANEHGVDITVLRPTVLYGEGMNLNSSGMKTFTSIRKGFMPMVKGGRTIYNLLHVDNLVHSIILSVENGSGFNIYNVSEGPYTHQFVVKTIEKELGKKGHIRMPRALLYLLARFFQTISPLMKGPPPVSMTKYHGLTKDIWHTDFTKIGQELDYIPQVTLEEGVKRTVDHYGWKIEGGPKEVD